MIKFILPVFALALAVAAPAHAAPTSGIGDAVSITPLTLQTSFGDGTHAVTPGIYRASHPSALCFYEVRQGNGFVNRWSVHTHHVIVKVLVDASFTSRGCGRWVKL